MTSGAHRPLRRAWFGLAILTCSWLGGCSSKTSNTSAPAVKTVAQNESSQVNLNEIFPAGRGRELLLNNCTSCHTFVPLVVLQLTKEAWERNKRIHRERVPGLSDADFDALYDYLEANFNPNRPVPKLPQSLLDTWTTY